MHAVSFSTYAEILECLHQQSTTHNVGDVLYTGNLELIIDAQSAADNIEKSTADLLELVWAIRPARSLTDKNLCAYDIFGLDKWVGPLKDVVVRGTKEHVRHYRGITWSGSICKSGRPSGAKKCALRKPPASMSSRSCSSDRCPALPQAFRRPVLDRRRRL